jgi:hypothetical protein
MALEYHFIHHNLIPSIIQMQKLYEIMRWQLQYCYLKQNVEHPVKVISIFDND